MSLQTGRALPGSQQSTRIERRKAIGRGVRRRLMIQYAGDPLAGSIVLLCPTFVRTAQPRGLIKPCRGRCLLSAPALPIVACAAPRSVVQRHYKRHQRPSTRGRTHCAQAQRRRRHLCAQSPERHSGAEHGGPTITMRLREALPLIDVRVLDHVIVGAQRTTSMAERAFFSHRMPERRASVRSTISRLGRASPPASLFCGP